MQPNCFKETIKQHSNGIGNTNYADQLHNNSAIIPRPHEQPSPPTPKKNRYDECCWQMQKMIKPHRIRNSRKLHAILRHNTGEKRGMSRATNGKTLCHNLDDNKHIETKHTDAF